MSATWLRRKKAKALNAASEQRVSPSDSFAVLFSRTKASDVLEQSTPLRTPFHLKAPLLLFRRRTQAFGEPANTSFVLSLTPANARRCD